MVMNGYDTDADGGNNFYTVNGRSFYYARYPIRVRRSRARPHLPRQPDRVRSDQLVPPARRLLPLPADRHGRVLGVHRHGDAVPGPARRARDRVRQHRHVHVPRPPVRVRRARLDGLLRGRRLMEAEARSRRPAERPGGCGRSRPCSCSRSSSAPSSGRAIRSSSLSGVTRRPPTSSTSAASSSEPGEIRVLRPQPAAAGPDDRLGHGRRRDRAVHRRRAGDAEPAALEHRRDPVRLGRGRPDLGRRHELDGDRDGRGDRRRGRDPAAVGEGLPRLRDHRLPRRRRPRRARPALAAVAAPRRRPCGWPPSWR